MSQAEIPTWQNTQGPSLASTTLQLLPYATVTSISYRLAPENKFPMAPNDVWDNLK